MQLHARVAKAVRVAKKSKEGIKGNKRKRKKNPFMQEIFFGWLLGSPVAFPPFNCCCLLSVLSGQHNTEKKEPNELQLRYQPNR